jgi:hypothetical protein
MADLKISALPASTTPLAGTEVLPIVQSSTTKQVSVANLTAGRAVSASSLTATGTVSGAIVTAAGIVASTGANLGHAASRIIMSWEGGSGAFFQSYGPNASTLGEFSFRHQSSDASISITALQLQTGNVVVPSGSISITNSGKGIQLPGGITWTSGSGSPEGVVTAPVGSLYSRSDGGAGTSLYVKQSGSENTGWVGK